MFILFCLMALMLCGCEEPKAIEFEKPNAEDHSIGTLSVCGTTAPIYAFNFRGHAYIQFGLNESKAIVHDPDCACITKKVEK